MITRSHQKGDAPSTAVYSDCEIYRYSLTRVWDPKGAKVGMMPGGSHTTYFEGEVDPRVLC